MSLNADNKDLHDVDIENVEESNSKETNENKVTDEDCNEKKGVNKSVNISRSEQYPPSFFTDQKGNLKFVNLVVRNPCLVFLGIIVITVVILFLLVNLVFSQGNPFTAPGGEYDMKDVRSIAYDSLRLARDNVQSKRAANVAAAMMQIDGNDGEEQLQSTVLDLTYWVFESEKPGGVFGSVESISGMKEALELFTGHEQYQDYCWKVYNDNPETNTTTSACRPPASALNMYYAKSWDSSIVENVLSQLQSDYPKNIERYNALGLCVERNISLFCDLVPSEYDTEKDKAWARKLNADITAVAKEWNGQGDLIEDIDQGTMLAAYLMRLDTKRGLVDFGYDKNFGIDNPVSMFSRAILTWGGPLNITDNEGNVVTNVIDEEDDRDEDEVESEIRRNQTDFLKRYVVDNMLTRMDEIATPDHNPEVNSYYFMGALILEVLLKIATKDATLALISFAFVFSYIRLSVGSWFLAMVGMLEIILSLPISWFIFSVVFGIKYFSFLNILCIYIVAAIGADDIFIFMDAYKHSAYVTSDDPEEVLESLESRMSWVYRRTGSAMAITSATTCSAFLCTLITPLAGVRAFGVFAAIVIFIDYVLVMSLFCTAVVIYHNKFEKSGCCSCKNTEPSPTVRALERALENTANDDESDEEHRNGDGDRIGQFFRTKVAGFLNVPKHRMALFGLFTIWIIVAAVQTTKLEATKEAEQFLSEDHPLQKSFSILGKEFGRGESDIGLMVYFSWGVNDVDRTGVNQLFDPEYLGKHVYDTDSFEFNKECQKEMLNQCLALRTSTDGEYDGFIKQEGGTNSVRCFIEEFAAFSALNSLKDCNIVKSGSWRTSDDDWTIEPSNLPMIMNRFMQEKSCYSDDEDGGKTIMSYYENDLGWDGADLRYISLSLENQELDPFSSRPESVVREQYDMMLKIAAELDTSMKNTCYVSNSEQSNKVVMTDLDQKFVFMNNQRIYVSSAMQSSFLGVGIAFIVLLISTRVLHIAAFATFSIICVLVSVTGSIVMAGWSLGSIEAILISITAGFSVDYVVHLAHAYEQARHEHTIDRIRAAFGEMGISVFNGMATSVGASIPLFFCQLQFFKKFGTFLCLTIAFSWLFANFAFMTLLGQAKIPVQPHGNGHDKKCISV